MCICAYMHTYVHTCIHIYVHIYIKVGCASIGAHIGWPAAWFGMPLWCFMLDLNCHSREREWGRGRTEEWKRERGVGRLAVVVGGLWRSLNDWRSREEELRVRGWRGWR